MYELWFKVQQKRHLKGQKRVLVDYVEELVFPDGTSHTFPLFGIASSVFLSLGRVFGKGFLEMLIENSPGIDEYPFFINLMASANHIRVHAAGSEVEKVNIYETKEDKPFMPVMVEMISDASYKPLTNEYLWEGERDAIDCREEFYSLMEWMILERAISDWLMPVLKSKRIGSAGGAKYYLPRERFVNSSVQVPGVSDALEAWRKATSNMMQADLDDLSVLWLQSYLEGTFRYRTSKAGGELLVTENHGHKSLSYLYKSESWYSLAWIEIMWAIQNGVYARFCDICGSIFQLKPPYERAAYTCCEECAKIQKIRRMGGIEAFRKYNREAQNRSRNKR